MMVGPDPSRTSGLTVNASRHSHFPACRFLDQAAEVRLSSLTPVMRNITVRPKSLNDTLFSADELR